MIFNQLFVKKKIGEHIPNAVEESQDVLCQALNDERLEVVCSAIFGLGHRPTPDALSHFVTYASHGSANIRYAVAVALGSYDDATSIEALLCLATDKDDGVRNWATFALGSMHEDIDSSAIRELLWHNTGDKNEDVRAEALVGLAIRQDQRVVEVLTRKLTPDCMGYILHAAECIADPLLYPYLEEIAQFVESDTYDEKRDSSYWVSQL